MDERDILCRRHHYQRAPQFLDHIAEFTALGRDAECRALASAVRWHTESRVVVSGHRTVIFR